MRKTLIEAFPLSVLSETSFMTLSLGLTAYLGAVDASVPCISEELHLLF